MQSDAPRSTIHEPEEAELVRTLVREPDGQSAEPTPEDCARQVVERLFIAASKPVVRAAAGAISRLSELTIASFTNCGDRILNEALQARARGERVDQPWFDAYMNPSASPISVAEPEVRRERAERCVHGSCGKPLPPGRTRFCSADCVLAHNRERKRREYDARQRLQHGHTHRPGCLDCGEELHLGRPRK